MELIKDIIELIKDLNGIDILLYVAILILIILVVSLMYIIKNSDEEMDTIVEEQKEVEDLKSVVSTIENKEPRTSELTEYEAEQEEKAIISYAELLEKNKKARLNAEKKSHEEIVIKKIDLDTLTENKEPEENEPVKEEKKENIVFYNYQREEEFLKCLKTLNNLLN